MFSKDLGALEYSVLPECGPLERKWPPRIVGSHNLVSTLQILRVVLITLRLGNQMRAIWHAVGYAHL